MSEDIRAREQSRHQAWWTVPCLVLSVFLGAVHLLHGARKNGQTQPFPTPGRLMSSGRRGQAEGDINELLDFAIVGFPKTGTSFMEHYLLKMDETRLDNTEHCLINVEDTYDLLVNERRYEIGKRTKDGVKIKNGVKCPKEITSHKSLAHYEEHVPDIKFIVSTRHPVLWFQSFYNYRLRQTYKHTNHEQLWAPKTEDLIGPCVNGTYHYHKRKLNDKQSVCTDGAKFHHPLSRFGKTPMTSAKEKQMLQHEMSIHSFPRAKVFLMEVGQFSAEDQTHADRFVQDLQHFLGLEHELPPLIPHQSKELLEEVQKHVIDICDEEHDLVRSVLVEIGREAAEWIRDYFLKSPDVIVSSEEHFLELIDKWQYDPCIDVGRDA